MPAIVQTPLLHGSDAIELAAGTWAKRLLPVGTVEYKGRTLHFDRPYLEKLRDAFGSGAYDQVPFQLADAGNTHTNDPERTRGWVTGMQLRDDGLYVMVQTTEAGNRVLQANPRLGVSARIVEEYARSDGQYYPAAVQHVLGTLDPRITELGPWEQIEMSNSYGFEPDMVIDLSLSDWNDEPGWQDALEFAGGGHPLSPGLRKLAGTLAKRHPGHISADHVRDAADTLDMGLHQGALRHLRAAYAGLDPQAVHPADQDGSGDLGQSRDEINRQILLVQSDRDGQYQGAQETDHHPDVKARTDVTQPIPSGQQRMGTYANDYDNSYEFADHTAGYAALELAHAQAALRQAEDAARPVRRRTGTPVTEDRLAYALGRIDRGTYVPGTAERNLNFASESHGNGCSCGATGDDGRTVSTTHLAGCESALSSDEQAQYRHVYGEIAAQPFTDANGRTWASQHGEPMTLADHVEALTGQRVTRDPFESGLSRPELAAPQRVTRFGDYDDGGDPGAELSGASQAAVAALRSAMGLPDQAAGREEKRLQAYDHMAQRPAQRFRTLGEAADYGGETMRERAERMKQPVAAEFSNGAYDGYAPIGWDDGCRLPGELTGLTRHTPESLAY